MKRRGMAKKLAIGCAWIGILSFVAIFSFPTLVRDAAQCLYAVLAGL